MPLRHVTTLTSFPFRIGDAGAATLAALLDEGHFAELEEMYVADNPFCSAPQGEGAAALTRAAERRRVALYT